MMNRSFFLIAIALALGPAARLSAQSAAPAPDKNLLKAQVDAREKRADLLLDEIRSTDARIEDSIDTLLGALRSVGDSKDSRTKVVRMKEQTIDALQKNLAYFEQRRAAMKEELRNPRLNLTEDEKRRIIARLDERIEKRVRQVIDLNKSLPTHKDYERYKVMGSGWYGENIVENEDFKQNQRLTARTNTQRDKLIKDLQDSLSRLDRQNRTLRTQLQSAGSDASRKALSDEIAKNDALAKTRRAQLAETLTPSETPTRPISGKEAQNLDTALRKSIDDLRREFTTLFQRYSVLLNERSAVNTAKAALAAMKQAS